MGVNTYDDHEVWSRGVGPTSQKGEYFPRVEFTNDSEGREEIPKEDSTPSDKSVLYVLSFTKEMTTHCSRKTERL